MAPRHRDEADQQVAHIQHEGEVIGRRAEAGKHEIPALHEVYSSRLRHLYGILNDLRRKGDPQSQYNQSKTEQRSREKRQHEALTEELDKGQPK